MSNDTTIMGDGRPILRIELGGDAAPFFERNETWGVDAIEPYYENGEMAHVVWYRIIKGGEIDCRINGKFVRAVVYDEVQT